MKSKRLYCVILAVVLATSLGGCGKKSDDAGQTYVPDISDEIYGHHDFTVTPTDGFIVHDGYSDYSVVLSTSATSTERMAAAELTALFCQATGVELAVTSDADRSWTSDAKALVVGQTSWNQAAGIDAEYAVLGAEGVRIKTVGNSVFRCGAGEYGTLYAVYEFLHQTVGFETYYEDAMWLDTTDDVPLMNYDITDVPDFQTRVNGNGFIAENKTLTNRLRLKNYGDCFIYVNGREVHNSMNYLPEEQHKQTHPYWYGTDGNQLCYTARGDTDEYDLMVKEAVKAMQQVLKTDPGSIITFTQEDVNSWCGCETCAAEREKYGTDAAVVIKFCNDLNRKVREWFLSDEGKPYARDLNILFFAYDRTTNAPVVKNEAGEWQPIDDTVVCDEGVSVFYAPIDIDYLQSIHADINSNFKENFDKWSVISDKVFLWLYSTDFNYFLTPYDTVSNLSELYRFSKASGADFMYNQGQHNQYGGATAWHILKAWLSAKLMWNVNADVGQLLDEFFEGYFGEAADAMRAFYDEAAVHSAYIKAECDFGGLRSVYIDALKESYWPRGVLLSWKEHIDEAYSAIEPLKASQPERYDAIYDHITMEKISVDYMLIKLHLNSFSTDRQTTLKNEFTQDLLDTGLTRESQYSSIAELLDTL